MPRRSSNVLATTNQPGAVVPKTQLQNFQNVQLDKISDKAGINPFAGDLTQAFTSFFGQVQDAIGNLQSAEFTKAKLGAEREAIARRRAGAVDAFEMQQEKNTDGSPKYASYQDAQAASTNAHKDEYGYSQAFQEAYGKATAGKLWADFKIESQGWSASQFESKAQEWWSKNYGKGSGSDIIDLEMQSTWARNFQNERVDQAMKALENSRSMALSATSNSAFTIVNQPGGWGYKEFDELYTKVAGINPNATAGKVRAATLDMLAAASITNGQAGMQNFLSFLDKKDPSTILGEGQVSVGQSLSDRFPADIAALRNRVYTMQQQYVTAGGVNKVSAFNTKVQNALTETQGNTAARVKALSELSISDLGELNNTPGVNMAMYAGAKAEITKHLIAARDDMVGMAQIEAFAFPKDGQPQVAHPNLTIDKMKDLLPKMIGETKYNFLANPQAANATGNLLSEVIQRFGTEVVGDDVLQMIKAGLMSDDERLQTASQTLLRTIDPDMKIARQLFKDDQQVSNMFSVGSDGSIRLDVNDLQTPGLEDARTAVQTTGIEKLITGEEKKADIATEYQSWLEKVYERVQENKGLDGWFTSDATGNPAVNDLIKRFASDEAARMLNNGGAVDADKLAANVAKRIDPLIHIDEGMLRITGELPNDQIPLGNQVPRRDGTGGFEDVISNMNKAVDSIPVGLTSLKLPNGEMLDDGDQLGISYNKNLGMKNVYQVVYKDGVRSGTPVSIPIRDPQSGSFTSIDGSRQYREDGKEYSWWQTEDNNFLEFKLTGNVANDELLLKRFVHPSIRLIPFPAHAPTMYYMGVEPHFNKFDGKYMTFGALEELANSGQYPKAPLYNEFDDGNSIIAP
jgi:hypothetical protein